MVTDPETAIEGCPGALSLNCKKPVYFKIRHTHKVGPLIFWPCYLFVGLVTLRISTFRYLPYMNGTMDAAGKSFSLNFNHFAIARYQYDLAIDFVFLIL